MLDVAEASRAWQGAQDAVLDLLEVMFDLDPGMLVWAVSSPNPLAAT